MKKTYSALIIPVLMLSANAQDEATTDTPTTATQPLEISEAARKDASMGVGYLHAKSLIATLKSQGYHLSDYSIDAMTEGFREALSEKDSVVKADEFKVAVSLMQAKLQERELGLSKINEAESEKWLKENAKKDGVVTTASGLQYKVLKAGEGKVFSDVKVKEGSDTRRFLIRYVSSNTAGVPIEQSPADQFISVRDNLLPGLDEALKMMPEGSHWKLFLKPDLAYKAKRLPGKLPPSSVVVIDVLMQKITQ